DSFFGGGRTIPLLVAAIPETTFDGQLYREFVLDANDSGNDKCMSIDDIKLFVDAQKDLKGFDTSLDSFNNDDPTKAVKIYDLDIPILMSSQRTGAPSCGGTGIGESGSGNADITVLIPNDVFPANCNYGNPACDQWLYFWTEKGGFNPSLLSDSADRARFEPYNWNVTAGFEEWNTRLLPVVSVTKTANPSFTQSHVWTIEKLVAKGAGVTDSAAFADAQTLDMFTGDSEDVTWKVTVTKGAAQTSNVKVAGTVTVKNPTGPGQVIPVAIPATINSVTDVLNFGGPDIPVSLSCPVTFPYVLAAGATLNCTYDQAVASAAVDGVNTAKANINIAGGTKDYFGSKDVLFSAVDPTVIDGSVDVSDTNGEEWLNVGSGTSWTYDDTFTCDDDEGQNNNEATFVTNTTATSGSDDADVFVNCYQPQVSKTVSGTYDIGNTWEIDKGDDGEYHLFAGDSVVHDYDIDVTLTQEDGPGKVSGTVTVGNPNPEDDLVVRVVDTLSDGTDVTLSCNIVPALGLYTIPKDGGELSCTYTDVADPDRNATSNKVTATLNGIDYEATENFTYSTVNTGVQEVGVVDENDQDGTSTYGPFTGDDMIETSSEYGCSTDVTEYGLDGTYTYSVDNTATLTDEQDVKFGTPATATVDVTCYIPVVSKTADGSSDERHEWGIEKDFDETYDLFAGQSVTHDYEIKLTETVTYENFEVTGEIKVTNPHPTESMTVTIADQLDDLTDATIDGCTGGTLTGDSLEIPADTTATCDYTASPSDDDAEENTATVTTENDVDVSATVDINWSSLIVGYDEVNVTDDYATADPTDDETWGPIATSDTLEYDREFTCPTDLTLYTNGVYTDTIVNTATIDETGADDDATVTLNCYALDVSKTAVTTYTRTYDWKIVKDAVDANGVSIGPDGLMLAFGQSYLLDWKVTVSLADIPYLDSDHRVDGVITITNPSPSMAMVDVTDEFTPTGELPIALSVDCDPVQDGPQSTGVQVPAEGSLECTYGYATADDGVNTATATLTQAPMTAFTGTKDVVFGAPTTLVNDSVIVTDTFNGGTESQIGTATVGESPKVITVSTLLSSDPGHTPDALLECGENLIINDAAVYVNDDGSLGTQLDTAGREVPVLVACDFGCTLTQGYWKTHNTAFWGGAPADDTWLLLGDVDGDGTVEGASEQFFGTDKTWFDVMWTAPKGGDAYYQLAHQWIAAKLNVLNGAGTTPAVDAALAHGEDFFANNPPDGSLKGKLGKDVRAYASTLAAYNEGDIGPGHCDEDRLSVAIAPLLIGAYFWQRRRGRHRATR
ncbi:MAG: hypothetical protein OEY98_11175, partial [Acidimicrobiia bacterium]|nr:hypothetical protein [Acidimicrobiia bacterium]